MLLAYGVKLPESCAEHRFPEFRTPLDRISLIQRSILMLLRCIKQLQLPCVNYSNGRGYISIHYRVRIKTVVQSWRCLRYMRGYGFSVKGFDFQVERTQSRVPLTNHMRQFPVF